MTSWQPQPGDRVRYAYDLTGDEPEVHGTVQEVCEGPDVDYFLRPIVSVRVEWDASEREVHEWVILGRVAPLSGR